MRKSVIAALLALFICCSFDLPAQGSSSFKDYSKELIFEDNFTDNRNNWRTFYSKVKKGRYNVETIGKDSPATVSIPVEMDGSRNYEIKIIASMVWNRSKDFMGIVWNRDLNNGYYLAFNKELQTKVYQKKDNKDHIIEDARASGAVRGLDTPNEIIIRHVDQVFTVYLNRHKVATIPADEEYRNHIGFFVGEASELQVTYFKVSYLN